MSFAGSADRPNENQISLAQNLDYESFCWLRNAYAEMLILMLKCLCWIGDADDAHAAADAGGDATDADANTVTSIWKSCMLNSTN